MIEWNRVVLSFHAASASASTSGSTAHLTHARSDAAAGAVAGRSADGSVRRMSQWWSHLPSVAVERYVVYLGVDGRPFMIGGLILADYPDSDAGRAAFKAEGRRLIALATGYSCKGLYYKCRCVGCVPYLPGGEMGARVAARGASR